MQASIGFSSRRGVCTAVLAAEAMIAVGLIAWNLVGGYAMAACVGVGLLATLRPVRTAGRNRWHRLRFTLRRARRHPHDVLTPAFDVTLPGTSWGDGVTGPPIRMGVRWVNDTLLTMLSITTAGPSATSSTPDGVVDDLPGQTLTTEAIAQCLNTFDITVDSVDLITHGQRMTGPGHIATVYHRILGPVPAVANRVTFLVIRLRPADCTDAIVRRGGGSSGALRAASVTTRRIAAALHDAGIGAHILSARQFTDATLFLTDGIGIGATSEGWSALTHGDTTTRTFAITPDAVPRVAASTGWSHAALSATLTLRVRPRPQGAVGTALLRVTECAASNRVVNQPIPGLVPLPGRQFEALCATLPVGSCTWFDRALAWTPLPSTHVRVMPGGSGQLIGADTAGRAVTVPLSGGPDVLAVGAEPWIRQLVVRAIATGARARIVTDRPAYWRQLIAVVADADALSLAGTVRTAPPNLLFVDEKCCAPTQSGDTPIATVYLAESVANAPAVPTGISLIQDARTRAAVDVEVGGRRRRVSLVATADEGRLLRLDTTRAAPTIRQSVSAAAARPEPTPERTLPLMLRPAR